jgi:hypothetical protein
MNSLSTPHGDGLGSAPSLKKSLEADYCSPEQFYTGEHIDGAANANLLESFKTNSFPSTQLGQVKLPPRRRVVGEWFREGDLSFIYARRGLGKTWFSLGLGLAIAGEKCFGPWPIHENMQGLYIDGEMPYEEIQSRVLSLGAHEGLTILNHEALFHGAGATLNLTSKEAQAAISAFCAVRKFKFVVLDNLSCLFTGMAENDADAWEAVLPWLLEMRRAYIAVVIVAHSGRDGRNMRGTSRREDAAFSIIRLDETTGNAELKEGAQFIARFTKDRNSRDEQPPYQFQFNTGNSGQTSVTCNKANGVDAVVQWVRDGLDGATDIAHELGLSKGQVSKLAKKAEKAGDIKIANGKYHIP